MLLLWFLHRNIQNWVGSSVIHLGDHNVPSSLTFIDKYTQVSRILSPIVSCLEQLQQLVSEENQKTPSGKGIAAYIQNGYGGVDKLTKDILYDFFR
jgi:Protein of unknown function (DUF2009)